MIKLLKETNIYNGKIFKLKEKIYEQNNKIVKREIINHLGGVTILAVENNEIFFVKQYRHAVEKDLLELPAGKIEENEDPLTTAHRELQEEIGYDANEMELLTKFYPTPGYSNEIIYLYLAKDLKKSKLPEDDDEDLEIIKLPIEDAKKLIYNKEVIDGKTLTALLLYFNKIKS